MKSSGNNWTSYLTSDYSVLEISMLDVRKCEKPVGKKEAAHLRRSLVKNAQEKLGNMRRKTGDVWENLSTRL